MWRKVAVSMLAVLALGVNAAGQSAPAHAHYSEADTSDASLGPTTRDGRLAPRLQNLGDHHHRITTRSEMAQKFFDQGLRLSYGFNHAEAARAFREAAWLDPEAAMAYWGEALVLGPNINAPMAPEAEPEAYALVQKALALRDKVSEKERAYLEALATRYSGDAKDRAERNRRYAEAMRKLAARYPDDLDAATL